MRSCFLCVVCCCIFALCLFHLCLFSLGKQTKRIKYNQNGPQGLALCCCFLFVCVWMIWCFRSWLDTRVHGLFVFSVFVLLYTLHGLFVFSVFVLLCYRFTRPSVCMMCFHKLTPTTTTTTTSTTTASTTNNTTTASGSG